MKLDNLLNNLNIEKLNLKDLNTILEIIIYVEKTSENVEVL